MGDNFDFENFKDEDEGVVEDDEAETEDDELAESGLHVEGGDDEDDMPMESDM